MTSETGSETSPAGAGSGSTGTYRIGDLAREFEVSLRTLRFYEDKGLIEPERRGTTRIYSQADRDRLSLALFGKRIGLALSEIRTVLEKALGTQRDEGTVRDIFVAQRERLVEEQRQREAALAELDERIAALN